jgi:hypothetical protein
MRVLSVSLSLPYDCILAYGLSFKKRKKTFSPTPYHCLAFSVSFFNSFILSVSLFLSLNHLCLFSLFLCLTSASMAATCVCVCVCVFVIVCVNREPKTLNPILLTLNSSPKQQP